MTKVAIVTGSNKGIGLGTVRALCKKFEGDVYLTSRNDERGLAAVKLLESEGLKPKYHQLDIENAESVQRLYDDIMNAYGGVDVLVNNAGVMLLDTDTRPFNDKVDTTININFTSTRNMMLKFFPVMKPNGRVVIVSSEASTLGSALCSDEVRDDLINAADEDKIVRYVEKYIKVAKEGAAKQHGLPEFGGLSPYLMSKIGATLLGEVYGKKAAEQGKGVLVNACCPGYVDTDLTKDVVPGSFDREKITVEEGADTPTYLALLPENSEIQGRFIVNRGDKTDIFKRGEHRLVPRNR